MAEINEKLIVKLYEEGDSIRDIAGKSNLYPSKIQRILQRNGVELRSKKEAGKLAVENGKIKPPQQGKKLSEDEKLALSQMRAERWKSMSDVDRENFKKGAKERWAAKTDEERADIQQKAGQALRKASKEGSKLEKFLYSSLTKAGYYVTMHVKGLVTGEKYEVDLFLPKERIAIEIDGPQHFLPVYGRTNLEKTIEFDNIKNGALISRNIYVIRVKYLSKHNSDYINRKALEQIIENVEKIKNNKVGESMLMEIEIGEE